MADRAKFSRTEEKKLIRKFIKTYLKCKSTIEPQKLPLNSWVFLIIKITIRLLTIWLLFGPKVSLKKTVISFSSKTAPQNWYC